MAKPKRRAQRFVEGTAETIEAPGTLRRYIRFAKLASGSASGTDKIGNVWATFLKEVEDMGVPPEAISRMRSVGVKGMLRKSGLPKSVASLLDKNNLDAVKEVQKAARAAIKGFSGDQLKNAWRSLLQNWENSGVFAGKETALAQLKKLDPASIIKAGANQTSSALNRVTGPVRVTVSRMYNDAAKLLPGKVGQEIGESVAKAGEAAGAATGQKLLPGAVAEEAPGLGKRLLGKVGGKFGAGLGALFLGFELKRNIGILGRESRAKDLAMTGYQGLGPASSAEYLRNIVQQQEMVARRKATMQQFEPDLFQDVVRVLADTGPSKSTLTSTERQIGSNAQVGGGSVGRSDDDVRFLLDQLFSQMGGGTGANGTF